MIRPKLESQANSGPPWDSPVRQKEMILPSESFFLGSLAPCSGSPLSFLSSSSWWLLRIKRVWSFSHQEEPAQHVQKKEKSEMYFLTRRDISCDGKRQSKRLIRLPGAGPIAPAQSWFPLHITWSARVGENPFPGAEKSIWSLTSQARPVTHTLIGTGTAAIL